MNVVSRRSAMAALVVVLAVSASSVVLALGGIDRAAERPSRTATRVDPPAPVIVIGDSAIAALRWVPGADNAVIGFSHTLDLESCRRIYYTSCSGREGRRPPSVYEALDFHNRKYATLVVATGYNDGSSGMATSFQQVVARARQFGYDRIIWYTLRSDVDYLSPGALGNFRTFAESNAAIRGQLATGRYPEVTLADWGGYAAAKPEWFVTDGVHYRTVGAWAAADYLSRKMAFLDGRACPMPVTPSESPQNPCPDPDLTGPLADIDALYPIGEDGVLCYEVGDDRHVECRQDAHVIQLTRELRPGMSGSDVSALQTRLQRIGLLGSVDGSYGTLTTVAVSNFQTTEALPVTGIADRATLARLGFDVSAIETVP
jgi:hypothetical protein